MMSSNQITVAVGVLFLAIVCIFGVMYSQQSKRVAQLERSLQPKSPKPIVNWMEIHGNTNGQGYASDTTYFTFTKVPNVSTYRTPLGDTEWMVTFSEPSPEVPVAVPVVP